jgi:small subunit ribosomal protein S6
MKSYELSYLISPDLSEEELNAFQEKINKWVQEEKGILGEINKPQKRILAYPIKKMVQAYLSSINFQLNPGSLLNIEKKLKNEGQIIRYLILFKKPRKVSEKRIRRIIKKLEPPSMKAEAPKKEKAELETIEQKLEEILK